MSRFVATLNGAGSINIPAERMAKNDNFLYVWRGNDLVAMIDVSVVISAHISEGRNENRAD